jgi:xanthine/uracil permease
MESGLNQAEAIQLLEGISTSNTTSIEAIPGVTPLVIAAATAAAKAAYQKSFQTVYLVSIAFGAVAIISAVVVNRKKLNDVMTPEIARKLQGVGKERNGDEEKL